MKGRKQIGYGGVKKLEQLCDGLDKDADDNEIDNMLYVSIERFAELSNSTYKIIRQLKLSNKILEIIEDEGIPGFTKFMDTYEYEIIDDDGEVTTYKGLKYNLLAK
jgi:hypothetical protein